MSTSFAPYHGYLFSFLFSRLYLLKKREEENREREERREREREREKEREREEREREERERERERESLSPGRCRGVPSVKTPSGPLHRPPPPPSEPAWRRGPAPGEPSRRRRRPRGVGHRHRLRRAAHIPPHARPASAAQTAAACLMHGDFIYGRLGPARLWR